jgi:phenylacetate-CoA ligase
MKNYSLPVWLHHLARQKGDVLRRLDELAASQWHSAQQVRVYQLSQMRALAAYARRHCSFYRDSFARAGLDDPAAIRTIDDWRRLPVLTKQDIRANLDSLTADRDDLQDNQTGGSSGVPLQFKGNREFFEVDKPAAGLRAYSHGGYRLGDALGIIWGYDNDIPVRGMIGEFVSSRVYKRHELNSFALTPEKMRAFLDRLGRARVPFVKGYANSLVEVARFAKDNRIELGYRLRAVFSEAERLDPSGREIIEGFFGAKVFNYYGSREFGTLAVECDAHDGLHVNHEQVFLEVDDAQRVLVTSFRNLGTVFIRYEIGDSAGGMIEEPCSCGRGSARIDRILGRQSDNFVAPDGKIIHGEYVTHLFYQTRHIEQFQMIQEEPARFVLRVVSKDPAQARLELSKVERRLFEQFGAPLRIAVEFVPAIEKTRTGKLMFTISKVRG